MSKGFLKAIENALKHVNVIGKERNSICENNIKYIMLPSNAHITDSADSDRYEMGKDKYTYRDDVITAMSYDVAYLSELYKAVAAVVDSKISHIISEIAKNGAITKDQCLIMETLSKFPRPLFTEYSSKWSFANTHGAHDRTYIPESSAHLGLNNKILEEIYDEIIIPHVKKALKMRLDTEECTRKAIAKGAIEYVMNSVHE